MAAPMKMAERNVAVWTVQFVRAKSMRVAPVRSRVMLGQKTVLSSGRR
jgi:hypothetical protein